MLPVFFNLHNAFNKCRTQIFFDTVPFKGKHEYQIMRLIASGERPDRLQSPRMEDSTWNLIRNCWEDDPFQRPLMPQIVEKLYSSMRVKMIRRYLFPEPSKGYTFLKHRLHSGRVKVIWRRLIPTHLQTLKRYIFLGHRFHQEKPISVIRNNYMFLQ